MSRGSPTDDDLEITHGGVIAVDTEEMRDVGRRAEALAELFAEARAAADRAYRIVSTRPELSGVVDADALRSSADRVAELRSEAERAATGTLLMADAFEVVELRAEAEALALTDASAAAAVEARIDRMLRRDERLGPMTRWLIEGWQRRRFEGLGDQWDMSGLLPPMFMVGAIAGLVTGLGKIPPGSRLRGSADPVVVNAVASSRPSGPPAGVKEAFQRMPGSSGAQVAVEKYTMPDGTTRFVAYVLGTRTPARGTSDGKEPWDMKSNLELYTGQDSASYQATRDALAAAGAEPGDRVDVVGHSQGGMIANRLSMEGEYEVAMQITAGSPTEPSVGDDQTVIQVGHTDDVVRSLAAGGSAAGTGSADSFTASRVGDPADAPHDLQLRTHGLDAYLETAAMIDASDDPRAAALRTYWAELGGAVSVERTEYRAERTGADAQ